MMLCVDCNQSLGENSTRCEPCQQLRKQNIAVSLMTDDDLELVLAWRSNPEVYQHFREQNKPLSWEDHVEWFKSRNSDRLDFVIEFDGRRVGVISLNADDEVSIYLGDISARGNGVATAAVEWISERFFERTPIYAEVHEDNKRSKHLFKRCGFKHLKRDGDWLQYVYNP
jgi:RimJ/RimL family protein N-acetyltransferase